MVGTYNAGLVLLSVLVAVFVSHTALSLAARVASAPRRAARFWLTGGAVAMGCGIWSMHFIGMLAFSLPGVPLTYDVPVTILSLIIAIAISGFALKIASRRRLSALRLAAGALFMGAGISAMHYTGMSAIEIVPMISYDPRLVVASIAIAVGASFAALWLFFRLRHGHSWSMRWVRLGAAVVMGTAIAGMHYTAMAAARFAPGSYCLGGGTADDHWLAITIGLLAVTTLTITTILLVYDHHLESSTRRHNAQLADANAQLRHVATHDALTGLPNRLLLSDRLEQAIAQSQRYRRRFAVLVLDLDRFKSINDSLGHLAGDEMLKEVAQRLKSKLRRPDTLARLGGDEFVLILSEISSRDNVASSAHRILGTIGLPMKLAGLDVQTSASVGISLCPDDGSDVESLLQKADVAMYHAKRSGRGNFQFFAADINPFSREHLELENGLRRALIERQFVLDYQPKVDIRSGRIDSAEALIRWRHPERGLIAPASFIPLAEETGLIIPIGEWVLREACHQASAWQRAGLGPLAVAVNLSPRQLRQSDFVQVVRSAIADARLEPRQLELEITESAVMHDAEAASRVLRALSELGVRISVDDFGTGYSSLSYLRRLPLDQLKIDRAFIREVTHSRDDAEIVRAIVSLAHSLRLAVIAEGVESEDQLAFLKAIGCDQYQGYCCSRPVSAEAFVAMMRRHQATRAHAAGPVDSPTASLHPIIRSVS
ncbi:MAG TPA: EAL domain-containing protein [Steroidobacteraceae bacterium]|nr:EAL domain-containing protein [Steroidobacteraceae bacterium]